MNTFHRRLKARREERGVSIRKICKDVGVPKSSYEGWELDSFPRNPKQYKKLADYLEVSTEHLMFGTNRREALEGLLVHLERFIALTINDRLNAN